MKMCDRHVYACKHITIHYRGSTMNFHNMMKTYNCLNNTSKSTYNSINLIFRYIAINPIVIFYIELSRREI